MPMVSGRLCVFLTAVVMSAAVGCQPQPAATRVPPTLTPVSLATSAPVPTATAAATAVKAGYPSPAETDAETQPGYPPAEGAGGSTPSYPAPESGGPSGGMPAIENSSKITAKLIESAPAQDTAGYTRLHVLVLSSQDVGKMRNFTSKLVNTEVDLYIETAILPALVVGDQFEATVSYNGDEKGGKYLVKDILKK